MVTPRIIDKELISADAFGNEVVVQQDLATTNII
jgi:hypothetical protein